MPIPISEFADRLNQIMPIIAKEFIKKQANELTKGDITLAQFFVLDLLNRNGQSKMTDLARFMSVTTAAMTGIVDRLVKSGYAVRAHDDIDRRIIKITPTAKGYGLIKRINQQKRQMIIDIFGRISQSERDEYLRILTRIHDILIKQRRTE